MYTQVKDGRVIDSNSEYTIYDDGYLRNGVALSAVQAFQ